MVSLGAVAQRHLPCQCRGDQVGGGGKLVAAALQVARIPIHDPRCANSAARRAPRQLQDARCAAAAAADKAGAARGISAVEGSVRGGRGEKGRGTGGQAAHSPLLARQAANDHLPPGLSRCSSLCPLHSAAVAQPALRTLYPAQDGGPHASGSLQARGAPRGCRWRSGVWDKLGEGWNPRKEPSTLSTV